MATDDVYEIYRGPCNCGEGWFVVLESEPDHPFARASQRSWSTSIECQSCAVAYQIEHRDREFVVVRREDVQRCAAAREARSRQIKEFMARDEISQVRQRLIEKLSAVGSVAAVYRLVVHAGLPIGQAQRTFTRRYRGAEELVRTSVTGPQAVAAACGLLGESSNELALEAKSLASSPPLPECLYQPIRVLDVQAG